MENDKKKPVAVFFIDGANFWFAAADAFGVKHRDYDIDAITRHLCDKHGWERGEVTFYTGIPLAAHDPHGYEFWGKKVALMNRQGINVRTETLRYTQKTIEKPGSHSEALYQPREKGIDVSIGIDVTSAAYERKGDVFVVFSQDDDLRPALAKAREVSERLNNPVEVISAYPCTHVSVNPRGIDGARWMRLSRDDYKADNHNYHLPYSEFISTLPPLEKSGTHVHDLARKHGQHKPVQSNNTPTSNQNDDGRNQRRGLYRRQSYSKPQAVRTHDTQPVTEIHTVPIVNPPSNVTAIDKYRPPEVATQQDRQRSGKDPSDRARKAKKHIERFQKKQIKSTPKKA